MTKFYLLFILLSLTACSSTNQLEEFLGFPLKLRTPEIQIQQTISKLIQNNTQISTDILCELVKRGYLKAASELYDNYFVMNQLSTGEKIKEILANLKSKISSFKDKLSTSDLQVQTFKLLYQKNINFLISIEPAFKWAQTRQFVFLHLKFAHRLDSPGIIDWLNKLQLGCITVKVEKMVFANNSVEMIAFGIQANQPIKFHLNLTLYSSIIPQNCSWNLDSVGTMFINITKAEETEGTIWKRLAEDSSLSPQIWWEMKATHKQDMEDFIKILEEEEEKIERQEDKQRKDKRQKEREAKEAREVNKEAQFYDF